jgi:hypothetical protein
VAALYLCTLLLRPPHTYIHTIDASLLLLQSTPTSLRTSPVSTPPFLLSFFFWCSSDLVGPFRFRYQCCLVQSSFEKEVVCLCVVC